MLTPAACALLPPAALTRGPHLRLRGAAFLIKQWLQKTAGAAPETIAAFFKAQCDIDIDAYEYLTEEGVLAALNKGAKSGGGKKRKAAEE